jgi:alpha-beta hydrolase superfamily lysophospholipase
VALWWLVGIAALGVAGLALRAWRLRRLPPLEIWHRVRLHEEFDATRLPPGFDFGKWLALERRLFEELDREVYQAAPSGPGQAFDRYVRGSLSDPERLAPDANRTFELVPAEPRGAALLLHGLTDSPYSVRSLATLFHHHGLAALGLRLPGHGTAPSGLARVSRFDWLAAARLALARAAERAAGGPLYLVGYSAGGTLALHLALDALDTGRAAGPTERPLPRRIFLLSPAIGITYLARLANWHKAVSFLPGLEKAAWLTLVPEYDPFKYNSHHKNGADQLHLLCKSLKRRLAKADRDGRLAELPPVLTFQSAADATVVVDDTIHHLHARLRSERHELVLFDVNRWSSLAPFLADHPVHSAARLAGVDLPCRLTLVANRSPDQREVVARTRTPGSAASTEERLGLEWPEQVHSLSHLALPFPPDDPVYGGPTGNPRGDVLHLGTAHPRGERGVLRVPIDWLMRLRHNPFHGYLTRRIADALADDQDS